MEAVDGELPGRDVVPDVAGLRGLRQKVPEEVAQVLLGTGDVLATVQVSREIRAVDLVVNERVRLEHRGELFPGVAGSVPDLGEVLEVTGHLTFVPGDEDCLHVGEVLVQRGAPDAGLLGDLGHRHRREPVRSYELCRGVEGRTAHGAAVGLDRVVPQLRHDPSIRSDAIQTI